MDDTDAYLAKAPSLELHSMACASARARVSAIAMINALHHEAHGGAQCVTFPLNVRLSPLPIHKKPGSLEYASSPIFEEPLTDPSEHL